MGKGGPKAARKGSAATKRAPASAGLPTADTIRLAVAVVLAALAYLLVAAIPNVGVDVVRALVCGLVAGFAGRRAGDWAVCALVGAAGAVAGLGATMAFAAPQQVSASPGEALVIGLVLSAAVAGAAAWLASALPDARIAEGVAVAVVLGIFLFGTGVLPGPAQPDLGQRRAYFSIEPPAEQYAFDSYIFMRTNWLMQRGEPYYQAFSKSWTGDRRLDGLPKGLFNVRQPWIYYMWLGLPGAPGVKILDWYFAFSCLAAAVAYVAARRWVAPAAALLAPIALTGYFAMPPMVFTFPLSEYWGGMIAVAVICALAYERFNLAGALVVVAFAFRELMLLLVPIYVVAWLLGGRRRGNVPGLVLAVGGPVALFALHAYLAPVHGQPAGVAFWLQGGLGPLIAALRYSGEYAAASKWLYPLVPVAALAGALQARPEWNRWWLTMVVAVPVIALVVFSNGQWGDYWGAIAQPMLMTVAPLAAIAVFPSVDSLLPGGWTTA